METLRVVEIVLVLAGALLTLILQLHSTLKTVRRPLKSIADRRDRALADVGAAGDRLNRAIELLDDVA